MNNFLMNLYYFIIIQLCKVGWHKFKPHLNREMSEGYINLKTGQSYIKLGECIRCGASRYHPTFNGRILVTGYYHWKRKRL